ncbi:uncharacterized protein LOC136039618 isoform X2 [Artemia franciscana]|uniref:uncharacterized protein LOC136039618 isoform X2 n=1 Tax=Artemia franciscana TaxID=6661 RepID=UPI0032DABF8E
MEEEAKLASNVGGGPDAKFGFFKNDHHVLKDTSNEDMNLLVMDDLLPSGQRSIVDEEILALSQANSFGELEEKKMNKMEFCHHLYEKVMKFVKMDDANEVMNEIETMAKNDVTMKIRESID